MNAPTKRTGVAHAKDAIANAAAKELRRYVETTLKVKLYAGNESDLRAIVRKHL